ncbi:MAG: hypothetical protein EPO32_00025 [Anaerolineae bacterium]|nr:MAG: hypothetical protein EPO32_00025 [Anaerolineae bacterium]
MFEEFPTIEIIPLDKLVVHEWHDDQRTPALVERLKSSGLLQNPPIVSPFKDGTGRYMVLDGANRTTALQRMGFPHVLAQIVEPDAPTLDLRTWNHVCWGLPPEEFFSGIASLPGIRLEPLHDEEEAFRQLYNRTLLALIQTPDELTHAAIADAHGPAQHIHFLNAIVDSYKTHCHLDRTRVRKITALDATYENLSALVVFPPLTMQEVLDACGAGELLPPGVTRFSVSPRALRVNYPLEQLASDQPLQAKNEFLARWIQERVARKGVRFYAEPTVLFDE